MKNKKIIPHIHQKKLTPTIFIILLFILVTIAVISTSRRDVLNPTSVAGSLVFEGANIDPVIAKTFGLRSMQGVLVASEPSGSLMKTIPLHRGDVVLTFNGVAVNNVSTLMQLMGSITDDTKISFSIVRNGNQLVLTSGSSLYSGFQPGRLDTRNITFVLLVFFIVFLVIFLDKIDRTVMVSLGAITMVIWGSYMGFFDQSKAFASINAETLSLLVGMGFFAIFFEQTNFFAFTSRKIAILSEGNKTKMMLFLCVITYFFSMFVNNLSTILIVVPIALKIADEFDMDAAPLLICLVISSNIGGASSMIGDFPNMLISSETKLRFHDFIFYMFPICLIELFALFIYMNKMKWISHKEVQGAPKGNQAAILKKLKNDLDEITFDQTAVTKGLVILSIVVFGFILSDIIHINPATIALAGGFLLLAVGGVDPKVMLRKTNFRDVLFFAALFVMVGAVDASGTLTAVSRSLKLISGGHVLAQALLILWISAFLTAFLNAGPSTALFIPIIFRLGISFPHNYIWWALSLGVLAGSSATLTGATAGAVTASLLEDHESLSKDKNLLGKTLSFRKYAQVGVPIMFIFLIISTVYITVLSIF